MHGRPLMPGVGYIN